MRVSSVIVPLAVFVVAAVAAADEIIIEDWKAYKVGAIGLPAQWAAQNWGTPNYQNIKIVDDDGRRALHMKSVNDSITLNRDIKGKVRLKDTPILEREWKSTALPEAAQIYVVWPRFPEHMRSRIIGYVWDTTQPAGTICRSEKMRTVTYIVVRSGSTDLNKWITEKRNVVEDFEKVYGDAPDVPAVLSLSTDSNDTNSTSEAMVGTIRFKSE